MPFNHPATVTSLRYYRGTAFARGSDIDPYLTEAEVKALYEKWQAGWPEPNEFQGSVKSITCEMVLEVPEAQLIKVFGKRMAARLREVAQTNGG